MRTAKEQEENKAVSGGERRAAGGFGVKVSSKREGGQKKGVQGKKKKTP